MSTGSQILAVQELSLFRHDAPLSRKYRESRRRMQSQNPIARLLEAKTELDSQLNLRTLKEKFNRRTYFSRRGLSFRRT